MEFNLDRFVAAQNEGRSYERAAAELRSGRKVGHWMWYVFPQVAGLGFSEMSQRYAIGSLAEAQAYLAHPVLGARLREVAGIVATTRDRSAEQIFGEIDAQKLRSSMTLFLRASPEDAVFREVIDEYFDGAPDAATDARLGPTAGPTPGQRGGTRP